MDQEVKTEVYQAFLPVIQVAAQVDQAGQAVAQEEQVTQEVQLDQEVAHK